MRSSLIGYHSTKVPGTIFTQFQYEIMNFDRKMMIVAEYLRTFCGNILLGI